MIALLGVVCEGEVFRKAESQKTTGQKTASSLTADQNRLKCDTCHTLFS